MTAFVGGFAQFFIPTHLLAVVALGLLTGRPPHRPALALIAFIAGLAGGSSAVASAIREMPASTALLILAALAAIVVVVAIALPSWASAAFGIAIGAALPINAPPHEITILAAIGAQVGSPSRRW